MLLHQMCFENIKQLVAKAPHVAAYDLQHDDPLWIICDASISGIGCMYGQGPTWQKCRPTGFMSKKFTLAQHNYCMFKLETLAIVVELRIKCCCSCGWAQGSPYILYKGCSRYFYNVL